uniref:Uncharacterized protein n=1 Tax=Cucumis melo TaxID=3656 RepID=A0A9I9E6L3_CUCME
MGTNSFDKSEDFSEEDRGVSSSGAQSASNRTLNPSLQFSHKPYDQDTSSPLNLHY